MLRPFSLAQHTLFADLLDQGDEDLFDPRFPENGSFTVRPSAGRAGVTRNYAYYQGYRPSAGSADKGERYSRYVGLADDPAVVEGIARFHRIKAARTERRSTVEALAGAGMPRPSRVAGRIIEALVKAGLGSATSVLIGKAAYQAYSGVLGVRLPQSSPRSEACETVQVIQNPACGAKRSADLLDALRVVDPNFALVPRIDDEVATMRFQNTRGFHVAVLTTHRHGDGQPLSALATPSSRTAMSWSPAELDFLVATPARSVVLHGPGIPVTVPAPGRFAVHKLIIHGRRARKTESQAQAKSDLTQAAELIEALFLVGRERSLAEAFAEAWTRDRSWRTGLQQGVQMLPEALRTILERSLSIQTGVCLGR